jgi:predicted DNA-binding WGR domain protein
VRYFEYLGGGSEKFWEIDQDGTTVTVRFGRLGTNGQTQVKELGTRPDADAHVARLIAEKVKRGYVEDAGTPVSAPSVSERRAVSTVKAPKPTNNASAAEPPRSADVDASEPPDESTWEPGSDLWRRALPWRGRSPERKVAVKADAAALLDKELADKRTEWDQVLRAEGSDPRLATAALRALGGDSRSERKTPAEVDALGAAAIAVLDRTAVDYDRVEVVGTLTADEWFHDRGPAFAAEAAVLQARVRATPANRFQQGPAGLTQVADGELVWTWRTSLLRRVRTLLATLPDEDVGDVYDAIDEHRAGLSSLVAATFLCPERRDWFVQTTSALSKAAASRNAELLLAACENEADRLAATPAVTTDGELLTTFVCVAGAGALPLLASIIRSNGSNDDIRRSAGLISQLPSDGAMQALIERIEDTNVGPALNEAVVRFPARATRLLAVTAEGSTVKARRAKEVLRLVALEWQDVARSQLSVLDAAARSVVEAVLASTVRAAEAAAELVPRLLLEPPWEHRVAQTAPRSVATSAASAVTFAWQAGERAAWERAAYYDPLAHGPAGTTPASRLGAILEARWGRKIGALASGPPDLVRSHLYHSQIDVSLDSYDEGAARVLLAKYETEATRIFLAAVATNPPVAARLLAPLEGTQVAVLMAGWLERKTVRAEAMQWFARHADSAARDLVPIAAGTDKRARAWAEIALRVLVAQGNEQGVRAAAAAHGAEVASILGDLLDADPLQHLPAKLPTMPTWLSPAMLPQVLVADRSGALPSAATTALCTMLALGKPGEPYPGVAQVTGGLDRESLARFAWGLLDAWRLAGYPAKEGWILDAQGLVGDDQTVRDLAPLIRAWPGEGAHKRAVAGLAVLSAIGSDVGLMHLYGISQKVKFKGLRTAAGEQVDAVAEELGLTREELADRLVPDFDLEADGSLMLDYGPRRFRVGFDEQLRPQVFEEDGTLRKVLPKPSAKDDAERASAAYAEFGALKQDVKTVAADQVRRLERAMVTGRRWTAADHRTLFIDHPLLWHLTRRVVWATFDAKGDVTTAFRVAEDRTLADADDATITIPDDATVGIAHPLHLSAAVNLWGELFADYEILQPFDQLGRDVHALTGAELKSKQLARFVGPAVGTGKILGLSARGWERGMPQDAGITAVVYRPLHGGGCVVVDLDPGLIAGTPMEFPEQKLAGVWVSAQPSVDWGSSSGDRPLSVLDPVAASELIRDLTWLTS